MFLSGLGTAVPPGCYSKAECWAALQSSIEFLHLKPRSQALLQTVLCNENGIDTRHLCMTDLSEAFALNPDAVHSRFSRHAPALASQAAERALAQARLRPDEIDAVIVSTCTGYLCPGLTSYVIERLGLRPDVQGLDLVGQGCGAALPNWRTAEALLTAGPARHVLSVCVEICSAAMYLDDDPGVLISACLFGDGAGAAVLSAEPQPHARRVEWKSVASVVNPAQRDYLRFEHQGGMLRNVLDRHVPSMAAKHAETLLSDLLARECLSRADISNWILHAGGREVLLALQKRLALSDANIARSAAILRQYGNVSSPCVLFVLEKALAESAPGGWWWMAAFGAGFSCYGALLKVD